jgi:hypothetical protein
MMGVVVSCRKETTNFNNPCNGIVPLKSNYKIEQSVSDTQNWNFYEDDTLYPSVIRFTCLNKYDSVKWMVGRNISKERKFELNFNTVSFNQPIKISMVSYQNPPKDCNNVNVLTDTLTKTVVFNRVFKFVGTFRGYDLDNPRKIFNILLKDSGLAPNGINGFFIGNLPYGISGVSNFNYFRIGRREAEFTVDNRTNVILRINYNLNISKNDIITIDYNIDSSTKNYVLISSTHKVFKGWKIN